MTIKQYNSSMSEWAVPPLTIIPPRSPDFNIGYGDGETQRRVAEWALDGQYALVRGADRCAHGLYRMRCPAHCAELEIFDHCDMWVDCGNNGRPFLLAHPYCDLDTLDIHTESSVYARAHGLIVVSQTDWDGWYGAGTAPIRFSPSSDCVVWPIEIEIAAALSLSPIRWPRP